jgi:hypothetical protein
MRGSMQFLPGTGRGTALAVEGAVEAGLLLSKLSFAATAPSTASRRFPSPFRGGFLA